MKWAREEALEILSKMPVEEYRQFRRGLGGDIGKGSGESDADWKARDLPALLSDFDRREPAREVICLKLKILTDAQREQRLVAQQAEAATISSGAASRSADSARISARWARFAALVALGALIVAIFAYLKGSE